MNEKCPVMTNEAVGARMVPVVVITKAFYDSTYGDNRVFYDALVESGRVLISDPDVKKEVTDENMSCADEKGRGV